MSGVSESASTERASDTQGEAGAYVVTFAQRAAEDAATLNTFVRTCGPAAPPSGADAQAEAEAEAEADAQAEADGRADHREVRHADNKQPSPRSAPSATAATAATPGNPLLGSISAHFFHQQILQYASLLPSCSLCYYILHYLS